MPGGNKNIRPEDGKPWSQQPENINREGRPKGSKNRSTILKKWIELTAKLKNPISGDEELGTVEDKVVLALISQALKGDISAIKEIHDTIYGKIADKIESKHIGQIQYKRISELNINALTKEEKELLFGLNMRQLTKNVSSN